MLEIASQITLCLLAATLIGFIMGYIVGKSTKKKVKETEEKRTTPVAKTATEEEVETLIQDEKEAPIEIPTAAAIEQVAEALESIDEKENDKPELLDAPKKNGKDALTQIKGIGPKVEAQLNDAGIYHFSQIASWTEANIQWLEKHTSFAHRAKKDLWVTQAKTLL